MRDIQVLCPMNRGGAGARSLNIELQAALNPTGERKIERFGWTCAPGDKVMEIAHDYEKEVYNGGIGVVAAVDREAGERTKAGPNGRMRRPFSCRSSVRGMRRIRPIWKVRARSMFGNCSCE